MQLTTAANNKMKSLQLAPNSTTIVTGRSTEWLHTPPSPTSHWFRCRTAASFTCQCCSHLLNHHMFCPSAGKQHLCTSPLSIYSSRRSHPQRFSRLSLPLRWISITLVLMIVSAELTAACGPGRGGSRRRSPRKLMPLVFKQHVPNVSENTLGASGLTEGRVTRNHKRFKELVPNYNTDIIFKDEEGTGADRLMTQRLKEKLNTLAISVMNQWPGVKLRVTEGWDEEGHHALDSLHYEGRAVDITTSDRDRSKYGMLARLAVEAGFDWVYYESRFHIHCSVKSEKSESARSGGCFDDKSIVYDRNGPKQIKDLQIGDEILSVNSEGKFEYSEVLMFLDRDPSTDRLYYEFETQSGSTITTTPSHLLFVADENSTETRQNMVRTEFARDVQVGQYLYSTLGESSPLGGRAVLDRIVKITTHLGRGAFAPLTATGNLVVNNITASCYAVIRSQTIAHFTFAPVRLVHRFVELGDRVSRFLHLFGSSSSSSSYSSTVARNDEPDTNRGSQQGIHWYANLLYSSFRFLIPISILYH